MRTDHRPSESSIAAIVCAMKKNRSVRTTVNYQYLNNYTVNNAYPMNNVEYVMLRISQSTFISGFDSTSGYWQTAMAEHSVWLSSFITRGLHEWVRSPFRL